MMYNILFFFLYLYFSQTEDYHITKSNCSYSISDLCTVADTIFWEDGIMLQWSDFKGIPRTDLYNAEATTNFSSKIISYNEKEIVIDIYAYFDCKKSWVLQKDDYGLRHELFHFHITELGARRLRKDISAASWTANDFERQYKEIANSNYEITINEQYLYDEETVHSLDTTNQLQWERDIEDSLREYSAYSNRIVRVELKK